ncbi:hypothetical protein JCM10213v2_006656 [Rhodosporidiobolus nylandii]
MSNHRQDAAVFDARVKHLLDSKPHKERSRQEILEKAMLEKAVAHVLVQEEELRQRGSDALTCFCGLVLQNQIASELDNGKERANSDLQTMKTLAGMCTTSSASAKNTSHAPYHPSLAIDPDLPEYVVYCIP